MPIIVFNTGIVPNDGLGDTLRDFGIGTNYNNAWLDANKANLIDGKLSISELPGYIQVFASVASFPVIGIPEFLYLDTTSKKLYYWDGANYELVSGAVDSVNGMTGVVVLNKSHVGLSNVDNTSDANKPVSTAQQTALNLKANSASPTFTGTVILPSTTSIGSVSNTEISYLDGVTSNIQTQLNGKEPSIAGGTNSQYWRGDKSWQVLDKTAVGLPNVDNTADANKPVSTAQQTALNLKANSASPTFTGTVILPSTTSIGTVSNTEISYLDGVTSNIQTQLNNKIDESEKGQPLGVATLDASGIILTTQLPSYIDDVLEFNNLASFPIPGADGKIYIAKDTNKTYRWSGSGYVYITSGAVDSVNGLTGVVVLNKSHVGLNNVDNTADATKNVLSATKLTTPRNINGIAFDGTANITITDSTKEPSIAGGTNSQYWRGDKSWQTLDKTAIGLPNVDNTSDATKNVLSATKLTTPRNINGVAFDGTANITITDSSKQPQLNGTGFVKATGTTISYDNTSYLPLTGGTLSGNLIGTTASFSTSATLPAATTIGLVTATEISYLDGVTSSIQTQLNSKQSSITNPVTGTGTTNFISKWTGAGTQGNANIFDNGNIGIGTTSPTTKLHVVDTNGGFFFDGTHANYNRFKSTGVASSTGKDLLITTQTSGTSPDLYISDTGNIGMGNFTPLGKLDIFTGLSGITTTVASIPNGTISFVNGGGGTAVPLIMGRSNDSVGLSIQAGTNNVNALPDMGFDIRENDNSDFLTLTTTGFRFSRNGTSLIDILRNGNTTFTGVITAPLFNGNATGLSLVSATDANANNGIGTNTLNNTTGSVNFPNTAGISLDVRRAVGSLSAVGSFQLWSGNNPNDTDLQFRKISNYSSGEVWTSWQKLIHAGNYNSYSPTLTGTGATGSWGISITGNASTAATLQTARTINGVSFNGSANITINAVDATARLPLTGGTLTGALAGTTATFTTINGALNGNASTATLAADATTLATPRTINGVAFDGSANITINAVDATARLPLTGGTLTGALAGTTATFTTVTSALAGNATTATTLQTARTINGVSFNGSANITINAVDSTARLPLTGGTLTGGLVGTTANFTTFTGALVGNASTATTASNAQFLNLNSIADIDAVTSSGVYREEMPSSGFTYTTTLNFNSGDGRQQLTIARDGAGMKFRGNTTGSGTTGWNAWKTVLDSSNYNSYSPTLTGTGATGSWGISVTGNSATATTLQTARTINGVSFNGSANITINAVDATARLPLTGGTLTGGLIGTTANFATSATLPAATTIGAITATEISYLDGVTSLIQTQLNNKANSASPSLTGTPLAPTATAGTNTTQIATTAFVTAAISTAMPATKVYKAIISQTGTAAPTVTVLENSLGTITFAYSSVGAFTVSSSGLFTMGKTFWIVGAGANANVVNGINFFTINTMYIWSTQVSTGAHVNGGLSETPITIEVYP